MIWWIIGGIAALLLLWGILRLRRYWKISDPKHYAEYAMSLATAVSAARKLAEGTEPEPADDDIENDPRFFMTSAGVLLLYTVSWEEEEGEYVHIFNLSMIGRRMQKAIGESLTMYTARLLGIHIRRLEIWVADDGTYDVFFALSPEEQRRFDKRIIPVHPVEYIKKFQQDCLRLGERLQYQHWSEKE